jgi:hypothetical protein
MDTAAEQRVHEIQRGEILRYLAIVYPAWATPKMLLYHLRDLRYPATSKTLRFHLEYLAGKGLLEVQREREAIGEEQAVLATRITPVGIDALDNRTGGDLGFK